jgi:hypothetical protein
VAADIALVSIGRTYKEDDVSKIGSIDEGMHSEDIAPRSGRKSVEVQPTVSADGFVGTGQ